MISKLLELDKNLFIYLNGFHTPWLDSIMFYMSETFVWIPLYMFLLYLIYRNYKNDTWLVVVSIALAILFSDQFTTGLLKPYFMRLRPSHESQLQGIVHIVNNYRGGLYGFASSHAANTFAVTTFLWLLLKQKHNWIILLFLWAVVVTYTRIYLGVHYPGDVLGGAVIGMLFGWIFYMIFNLTKNKVDRMRSTDQNSVI